MRVMSSRVLPFVSGTSFHTNTAAITHIMPYMLYTTQKPRLFAIGTNEVDTIQLNIHWNATAIATAPSRMVFGNTSAMSTQHIGPHENMKLAEYIMMEIMHNSCKSGLPKVHATPIAPTAMPSEPVMSRGLRPSFSTVNIATQVNPRLTIPLKTVRFNGSAKHIASYILGAKYSTALMPTACWNTESMMPTKIQRKP